MKLDPVQELKLLSIVHSPHTTEKSVSASTTNFQKFVFEVARTANKATIKRAFGLLLFPGTPFEKLPIKKVAVLNQKGKVKHFKQVQGKRKTWKKAYITLKTGHNIDLETHFKS